mgnify:CR=1 FL=1
MTGIPSIVAGLFIFAFLVIGLHQGYSGFAAALSLTILMLPVVVRSAEEMIKLVPDELREASYALGIAKYTTILKVVLPTASAGITTGVMIAIARITGETAPLLMIGMRAFIASPPGGITDPSTVLPVQIFLWSDEVDRSFVEKTSAAIIVLLVFMLLMNGLAIYLRNRFERRW